jgi:hypothetical protein
MSRAADRNTAPAPPSPISTTSPVPRYSADSTKGMSVTEQHSVWRATAFTGTTAPPAWVWLTPVAPNAPTSPFGHPIPPPATRSQCDPCESADPGTMLARNATLDDGREYALYLAWFGPDLTKVGLTATERGTDRLAEQGALAFTWLARSRLPTDHRGRAVACGPGPRGVHSGRPGRVVRPRRVPRFLLGDHHPGQWCSAQRNRALRSRAGSRSDATSGWYRHDQQIHHGDGSTYALSSLRRCPPDLALRRGDPARPAAEHPLRRRQLALAQLTSPVGVVRPPPPVGCDSVSRRRCRRRTSRPA